MAQANWQAHAIVRHVLYTSSRAHGILMLHFHCNLCGDSTDWQCGGLRGMPDYRLSLYCNDHLHGRSAPLPAVHPRHGR
jgi:hypothetical protein